MKKIGGFLCAFSLLFAVGCLPPVRTPTQTTGLIFTEAKFPGMANATTGSKTGTAESVSILSWVAVGDASIEAAAKNGGIKKVKSVEYKVFSILGLYGRLTTVVTGE